MSHIVHIPSPLRSAPVHLRAFPYDSDSLKGLRKTKPIARDPIYRRRVFNAEIIELCVRWYITYRLSYRDLVAMMAERGVTVAHSTILRWVVRYVPKF